MFVWFAGLAVVVVWQVFRSPALDHRMVVAGALLPLVEGLLGGPRLLHTLLGSVVVLLVVMLATRSRRLVRRRWLGVPIGMFLHLVLDGVWMRTEVFWWPFFGFSFGDGGLPELDRGVVGVALELVGVVALWVSWHQFQLGDPVRRSEFLRTGRVGRDNEQAAGERISRHGRSRREAASAHWWHLWPKRSRWTHDDERPPMS